MPSSSSHMFSLPAHPSPHPPLLRNLPLPLVQGKEEVSDKRGEGEGIQVVVFFHPRLSVSLKEKKNFIFQCLSVGSFTFFDIFDQKPKRELTSLFPPSAPPILADASSSPFHPTCTHARTPVVGFLQMASPSGFVWQGQCHGPWSPSERALW